MATLYWIYWNSYGFKLAEDSPDQGFDEMEDMFRYCGDMPRKAFRKPYNAKTVPYDRFYVEFVSWESQHHLNKLQFPRWNSFGAFTRFVDNINDPPELKNYKYNRVDTKILFNKLLAKNEMGMFADWEYSKDNKINTKL